jgi:acyl-CoA synthetase (AMP-forming)/AMP-acid ligase II
LQYFDEPEKTHEATYDDWFHSGDMGYFDEDEFLFISGRKKEILKYNNFQVSPLDIEEIIESLEDVEQSCVVGVLNEKTGNDLIVAFVKKKLNSNLTEDEILSFVDSKLIDAKRLRGGVHFVDSFPLTPSAKIKKMEMKKIAENMKL